MSRPPADAAKPFSYLTLQFDVAFSLMSIIPLLICCYLITVKFYSIEILQGLNGVYFLLAVFFALLGLLAGRIAIRQIFARLVETNRRLAQLSEQEAAFVTNVAHEFRAPLAIIKGAMDNLADGLHGRLTDDQLEPVAMCQRESGRLKRLVSDLLDVARIEAGKLPLLQEPVVLQELLRATVKLFDDPVRKRGLRLSLELPADQARVIGDRDRLQQVFVNLINNAVKFTERGGISIRLTTDDQGHLVEVRDSGRGIAVEDLDRVFDKFERVGTQTEEGSGLGLSIAKDIVELHHGRIWTESEPGVGSRFLVRLPLAAATDGAKGGGGNGAEALPTR